MSGPIVSIAASPVLRRGRSPSAITFIAAASLLCAAAAASSIWPPRTVLVNATASEPPGVYVRVGEVPSVGQIVAFEAPAPAFPYADVHLAYLRRVPVLKAVAGVTGDQVCTTTGRLAINGQDLAPIVAADGEGRALPHWRDCRRLRRGEVFVYSGRVPNSFDSRYFGPVPRSSILGVYAPVLTFGKAH